MNRKTAPIFLAFLCMGFLDAVGPFVGLAKKHFDLSNSVAQLIPFVGLIMFGVLSIPAGLLQDRTGKKFILVIGLIIELAGAAVLVFGLKLYVLFLVGVFMLGVGVTIMQVAGNPVVRDVSAPEKYSRNLSLAQAIKVIGSLSPSLIPYIATRWLGKDWSILFPIYVVALLVTVAFVAFTKIKEGKTEARKPATFTSCLALLSNRYILLMVMGIFIYVGAEMCVNAQVSIYLSEKFKLNLETRGILGNSLFFICLFAGRFLGSFALDFIRPKKFLVLTVLLAIAGLLGLLFAPDKYAAVASIMLVALGYANVFPLIFSIAIDYLPERSNEISGLMVTAIVGGALFPPLMGLLVDQTGSVTLGFLVPLACCLYLVYVALVSLKVRPCCP